MLKQISLKRLGFVGATAIAGIIALNSCKMGSKIEEAQSRETIENIQRANRAHNDSLLSVYSNMVQVDSINMINAQKAMKNINMSKLEKDYASASTAREKARMQLAIAEKDGKADIIADRNEKLNEVMTRTQDAVDAYNNALHICRSANGEFYHNSKNKYNTIRYFTSDNSYNKVDVSDDFEHIRITSPDGSNVVLSFTN